MFFVTSLALQAGHVHNELFPGRGRRGLGALDFGIHRGVGFGFFEFFAGGCGFALAVPHRGVGAVLGQKFAVATALHDAALVEH